MPQGQTDVKVEIVIQIWTSCKALLKGLHSKVDTIYNALNDSWEKQKEEMGLKSFYPYYGNIMTPISRFDMDSLMTSHTAGLKYF